MHRLMIVVLFVAFAGICSAQLNFTPNWGKRNLPSAPGADSDSCKESVETIMLIYKIIQNEAQKLVECEKLSN